MSEGIEIKIAKFCGWVQSTKGYWSHPTFPDNGGALPEPPEYADDLNAIHEAVSILDYEQAERFEDFLWEITTKENEKSENPMPVRFAQVNATARQRAEAFMMVMESGAAP